MERGQFASDIVSTDSIPDKVDQLAYKVNKLRDCLLQPGKFKNLLNYLSEGIRQSIESKVLKRVSESESAAKTNETVADDINYLKQQNDSKSETIRLQAEMLQKQPKSF